MRTGDGTEVAQPVPVPARIGKHSRAFELIAGLDKSWW